MRGAIGAKAVTAGAAAKSVESGIVETLDDRKKYGDVVRRPRGHNTRFSVSDKAGGSPRGFDESLMKPIR